MHISKKIQWFFCLLTAVMAGCGHKPVVTDGCHFTQMEPPVTNVHFNNTITENDSVNVFTNEYMYNGSGVGIGDFDNDGLQDVFFCGSMVSSKLYLNKGDFKFEDVTDKAGVKTNRWCTGVSVVDINSDGAQDIYVSVSHSTNSDQRKNLLFINDGKAHFTEQAATYGLADTGYATQAAFFDYDKDGDLDVYILNHRLYSHTANNIQPKDSSGLSPAEDRLYRNDGIAAGQSHPVFHDVSMNAGIKEDGYGLGIVITDVNNDNWPDIYVANDYIGNDLMWLNNQDGTFSNIIAKSLRHQSYNSMGVDAADINNDGLPDLAVVDMLPENNDRKKMMFNGTNQEKYDLQQRFGYEPSYMRNMLQLNNGNRMVNNKPQPFYSEIGQLAGMFETDWSWSVLMADFDNDGWKDMHITNGLGKDLTNNDYASFVNGQTQTSNYTFGASGNGKPLDQNTIKSLRKNIDGFGAIKMDNYLYKNNGDLTFSDITASSGLSIPSISNGAAYADLDNDGDLDLVVNNINQDALIWKNDLRTSVRDSSANFIAVQLKGPAGNGQGFGCKITIYNQGNIQFQEQSPVRGFSSSVDQRLYFGLGKNKSIDSMFLQWPDDKGQVLKNVNVNQILQVNHGNAQTQINNLFTTVSHTLFSELPGNAGFDFKHTESSNFDFGYHQPLAQKFSQLGPCLATADVNGDGLEDVFVGGAANQPAKLFMQQPGGNFAAVNLTIDLKPGEDLGAVFFDADGDKDMDMLVTGGSFEFTVPKYNQPRLYINNSKGSFTLSATALPEISAITDAIAVADYDGDGDLDVFIGGRLLPNKYPQSPRSYLLKNNGGVFSDVTKTVCSQLEFPGMVTGAVFTDFNGDKKPDLVISGEMTAIRFFKNTGQQFVETTSESGLANTTGLWRSLQQADIDNDGDMDYIAGNMGNNNRYHISATQPMKLYVKDMDKNGYDELIPAYFIKGKNNAAELFPGLDRNQLSEQLPSIKKKYLLHKDYSVVTMAQLKDAYGTDGWSELQCETTSSIWIENLGNGKFTSHLLPMEAQLAPVNSIVVTDYDGDGKKDLIIAGNEYQAAISIGRYDASYGQVLKGDGKGGFKPVSISTSGLVIDGDVKDMVLVQIQNKQPLLVVAPNDSQLKIFQLHSTVKH